MVGLVALLAPPHAAAGGYGRRSATDTDTDGVYRLGGPPPIARTTPSVFTDGTELGLGPGRGGRVSASIDASSLGGGGVGAAVVGVPAVDAAAVGTVAGGRGEPQVDRRNGGGGGGGGGDGGLKRLKLRLGMGTPDLRWSLLDVLRYAVQWLARQWW